jgi:hypothetical protein
MTIEVGKKEIKLDIFSRCTQLFVFEENVKEGNETI